MEFDHEPVVAREVDEEGLEPRLENLELAADDDGLAPPMITGRTRGEYWSLRSCPNATVSPASRSDPSPGRNGRPEAVNPPIKASGPARVMTSVRSRRGGPAAVPRREAVAGSSSGGADKLARGTALAPVPGSLLP